MGLKQEAKLYRLQQPGRTRKLTIKADFVGRLYFKVAILVRRHRLQPPSHPGFDAELATPFVCCSFCFCWVRVLASRGDEGPLSESLDKEQKK